MAKGTVKWFNTTKGFGLFQPDSGEISIQFDETALDSAQVFSAGNRQGVTSVTEQRRDGGRSATGLALA